MTIYRLKPAVNTYEVIDLDLIQFAELLGDDASFSLVRSQPRTNESLLPRWKEPKVDLSEPFRGGEPIPDISCKGIYLVLTDPAYQAFRELLARDGEFLPLIAGGQKFWLFNCRSFGKEDMEVTRITLLDGYPDGLEALAFDEGDIKDKTVFKSELDECFSLFVTDAFVQRYKACGYTGLRFDENLIDIF